MLLALPLVTTWASVYTGVPAEVAAGGAFPVTSVKTFTNGVFFSWGGGRKYGKKSGIR